MNLVVKLFVHKLTLLVKTCLVNFNFTIWFLLPVTFNNNFYWCRFKESKVTKKDFDYVLPVQKVVLELLLGNSLVQFEFINASDVLLDCVDIVKFISW